MQNENEITKQDGCSHFCTGDESSLHVPDACTWTQSLDIQTANHILCNLCSLETEGKDLLYIF